MEKQQRITEFQKGNLIFDVIDSGPIDGSPIVLLHGFPETSKIWQHSAEILNQHGFRTYALNQRGYSLRAQPKKRADYAIQHLADDVNVLLDLIGEPSYIVGHDWGAVVAWEVALRYPNKIKHLTAISVPHKAAFMRAFYSSTQLFKSYYMGLFQLPWIPELLFNKTPQIGEALLKNFGMTVEQLNDFKQEMIIEKRLSPSLNWYRGLPFSSNKTLFNKVKVPTLFIWGKDDVAIDAKGVQFNQNYVEGPYTEIHLEANHWIPVQNYHELTDLILKEQQKLS